MSRGLNVETGNFVAIKRIKRDKLAEEPLLVITTDFNITQFVGGNRIIEII